jgi:hypothetical protein
LALIRSEDIALVVQDMNFAEGETSGAEGAALFRPMRRSIRSYPCCAITRAGCSALPQDLDVERCHIPVLQQHSVTDV